MAEALTLEEIAEINTIKKITEAQVRKKEINLAQVASNARIAVSADDVRKPFLELWSI